jgi:DNA adenine methylase
VVTKYDRPETLFYMDPPYWQTEGYGVEFGLDQYTMMAEQMRIMKGKAIVSVNDHPAMREAFADLSMKTLQIKYTVGGAGKGKKAGELLIWSW